jgi:phenylacetate-CoA ligase
MNKIELSVIVPCFNEEVVIPTTIARIVRTLEESNTVFEIILINDGSTDSTLNKMMSISKNKPSLKVLSNASNQGIAQSWLTAIKQATGQYVVLIDADLQNQPEDIPRLLNSLQRENIDFVQGYRSTIERHKDYRFFYSRALNLILNILFLDNATDNKSGFLVGKKHELESVLEILNAQKILFPQTFIRVLIKKMGYTIKEFETLFLTRRVGESFLIGRKAIKAILQTIFHDLPIALFHFRAKKIGKYSKKMFLRGFYHEEAKIFNHLGLRAFIAVFYFKTMFLHKWLIRGSAFKLYRQLIFTQFLDRKELDSLQLKRLNLLLQHVRFKVPYYQKILNSIDFPFQITSLEDLAEFPLLSKEDVRANTYFNLFSINHKKSRMLKISTSGSSGQPFTTYADKFQLEMRFATTLRQMEWTGWRFGDRQVRLWHQKIGMTTSQIIKEKLDAFILRRTFIPAFEITSKNISFFINKIVKARPVLLDGYAESLNFLAAYLKTNKVNIQPKAVMSSAQLLPKQVREVIERELNTRLFDKYGSREFSGIAYQCTSTSNYHVMDESYIVEILVEGRKAKPGEIGEVVITDLNNFSFPLIRYRIGDLAVAVEQEPCECGRNLSQIGPIQGRTQAIVYCPNGVWMPGTFFAHFFKDYDSIVKHFQIIQEKPGEFQLNIVKAELFSEDLFNDLLLSLHDYVGTSGIEVSFVETIPLLSTGKRSPVVSKINQDFQNLQPNV